jgi:EpsI family protein
MKNVLGIYCALLGIMAATLFASRSAEQRPADVLAAPLETIPLNIEGWKSQGDISITARAKEVLRADAYVSRSYIKDSHTVDALVAYYAQQRAGESMHSPKHCLPGSGWEIWKHGSAVVPFDSGQVEVNHFSIQNGRQRMLMVYWYQSRQRIIASELTAKLLLVHDALVGGGNAGSIVRITVPDTPGASEGAVAFAAALMTEVQRCIGH